VVDEAIGLLHEMAAEQRITLRAEPAPREIVVEADRTLVRRVVLNLGQNAIKFTDDGGDVLFRVSGEGRMAQVEVKDTGSESKARRIEKIFDKFYQIDSTLSREYPGVGSAFGREEHRGMARRRDSGRERAGEGLPLHGGAAGDSGDAGVITHATWSPTRTVSDHLTRSPWRWWPR
jgi:hypothetical protein